MKITSGTVERVFALKQEPMKASEQLAAALAGSETVVVRIKALPAADRARLAATVKRYGKP